MCIMSELRTYTPGLLRCSNWRRRWLRAVFVLSARWLAIVLGLATVLDASPAEECYRSARFAAHEVGVPANVLIAVAKTETGRTKNGVTQPWPWAINVRGRGDWLASESELLEASLKQLSLGETLFDLGCFQINYRWHGSNFASIDEMISPRGNALYAAKFLKSLFREFGNWTDAVGAYHSRTEELATIYKEKFAEHYQAGTDPQNRAFALQTLEIPTARKRQNTFPLLQSATLKPRLGSLVSGALQ